MLPIFQKLLPILGFVAPAPVITQPAQPDTGPARFQKECDAILRGCAMSLPLKGEYTEVRWDGLHACALGAMYLGLGHSPRDIPRLADEDTPMEQAYRERYESSIPGDNDERGMSREQIAARIAAL